MSVDYSDFLAWSEKEIEPLDTLEFGYRNSSSRAYYALFHAARARLSDLGVSIKRAENAGSHEAVIDTIRGISEKGRSLASDMDRLKRFRNNCDYDIHLPIDSRRARKQVAESRRLIDMLSRL